MKIANRSRKCTNAKYRAAAKLHEEEGELEIDDDAKVSRWDDANGAYVQAWIWVAREELE